MSLVPCAACADREAQGGKALRRALAAQERVRLAAAEKAMAEYRKHKADADACADEGHPGMTRAKAATAARHAAARASR